MATIQFDIDLFHTQFPTFQDNPTANPLIESAWNLSILYISNIESCTLKGDTLAFAINALTAHMLQLQTNVNRTVNTKSTVGNITSTTIDKISVALEAPPPASSGFEWWLRQTPYGQQLFYLLKIKSTGGISVGGRYERSAFRKVGGVF